MLRVNLHIRRHVKNPPSAEALAEGVHEIWGDQPQGFVPSLGERVREPNPYFIPSADDGVVLQNLLGITR